MVLSISFDGFFNEMMFGGKIMSFMVRKQNKSEVLFYLAFVFPITYE